MTATTTRPPARRTARRASGRTGKAWGGAGPVRCTAPLSADYTTDADWFLPIIRAAWSIANSGAELDAWQVELIRRVLETYPPGHKRAGELRFRQVVISLARQNGKSVIGAILGLYGLLRDQLAAYVVGIASNAEQARIIYDRTNQLIALNPALRRRFKRLTDTRGLHAVAGGRYEIKPAKAASLQGLALSLGVVDELHLLAAELWQALVSGLGGRPNGLIVGITTAGSEESTFLLAQYALGERSIADDPELERFGFFVWEAPEARIPDRRDQLIRWLKLANPSFACGRIDVETVLSDLAGQTPEEIIRYRLNRFVNSSAALISLDAFTRCTRPDDVPIPAGLGPVFAIDRSPDWGYASIVVAARDGDTTYADLVASIVRPTLDQLLDVAIRLYTRHPGSTIVVDGYTLGRDLGAELRRRGVAVHIATQGDTISGSGLLYAKIARRRLAIGAAPLLAMQIPRAVRKNVGDAWRVSRSDSSVEIDAVMALLLAVHGAETSASATSLVL